jgi:hypothetical protein
MSARIRDQQPSLASSARGPVTAGRRGTRSTAMTLWRRSTAGRPPLVGGRQGEARALRGEPHRPDATGVGRDAAMAAALEPDDRLRAVALLPMTGARLGATIEDNVP